MEHTPNYMERYWEKQERDALKALMVARTALAKIRMDDWGETEQEWLGNIVEFPKKEDGE